MAEMYNPELDALRQEVQDAIARTVEAHTKENNVMRALFTEERKNLNKLITEGDEKLDARLRKAEQDIATIKAIQRPIWLGVGALLGAAVTKLLEWVGGK